MSHFLTQKQFMGPLSEITREFSIEDNIYRDMIYALDRRHIDEYNNLLRMIPDMIPKETYVSDKEIFIVTGVEIQFPNYTVTIDGKTSTRLLTPDLAKKLEKDYMCTLVVDYQLFNTVTRLSKFDKKTLGKFPCMVGSDRCILAHKPHEIPSKEQWYTTLGEDPSIEGGYFIKNGQKKALLYRQRLCLDISITVYVKKKKRFETRITNIFSSKTYVVRVVSGKRTASVKILPPFLKGKHLALFLALYLLSRTQSSEFNTDIFINQISNMSPLKDRPFVESYLETSRHIFFRKFCTFEKGYPEPSYELINQKLSAKTEKAKYINSNPGLDSISNLLKLELFPNKPTVVEKIANLLAIVSQHVRCCIGLRKLDNRDAWGLNRVITGTHEIEQDIVENIIPCIKLGTKDDDDWRIGKKDPNENVMESFKVDSINLTRSLLTKITKTVDDKTKEFKVRAVSKSGYGAICPAKTPEGTGCGLKNYLGILSRVSWNSEYTPNRLTKIFENLLTPIYSFSEPTEMFKYRVAMVDKTKPNGRFEFPLFISSDFIDLVFSRKKLNAKYEHPFLVIETEFKIETVIPLWNYIPIHGVPLSPEILQEIKFMFGLINKYSSMKEMEQYNYKFTYNSNVLLNSEHPHESLIYPYPVYVDPKLTVDRLKGLRRNGELPIDCCIYKNENDLMIQYYDEPGRILCPYLLADEEGDLIFDKINCKDLWQDFNGIHAYTNSKQKIDELFRRGALDYVDQKELETTFIAKNINEFRRFANLRKFLKSLDLSKSDSFCYKIKDSEYFKNEDITFVERDAKKLNVVFTTDISDNPNIVKIESRLDTGDLLELYGKIEYKVNKFVPSKKRILTLNKRDFLNSHKRDGFNLFFVDDDESIKIVPKGEADVDDTHYKGHKIISIKFKTETIYKTMEKINVSLNEEWIFEDVKDRQFTNTGKKWFKILESGEIIWSDYFYNNGETYNFVDFDGIPLNEYAFFESISDTIYEDLTTDMKYEKFSIETEKMEFDDIVKEDLPNNRYCALLISYVRRNQEHLDNVKFSTLQETNDTMNMLREEFPLFMKRTNIYKIMRYLDWRFKFTHSPIDPNFAYCSVANLVPSAHCNQGPRFAFQCAMGTQAIGLCNIMHFAAFDTSIKRLLASEGHLFETTAEEPLTSCTMPTRVNCNVAIFTNRRNPEDAIVMSKSMRNKIRYDRDCTITIREKIANKIEELIKQPVDYRGHKKVGGIYSKITENGLPLLGSIINVGDVIAGQTKCDLTSSKVRDISRKAQLAEAGEVVQIKVISTEDSKKGRERIVRIKIQQRRYIQIGDKGALPYSQKGTFSQFTGGVDTGCEFLIDFPFLDDEMRGDIKSGKAKMRFVDDNDMPVVIGGPNDGMRIHVLFSPFSFPSRMTLGMNFEMFSSKASLRTQVKTDASTFKNINIEAIEEILKSHGLNKYSCELLAHSNGEVMHDSITGTQMMAYIAPGSYQILKHNVWDKEAVRAKGPRDSIAQQPMGTRGPQRLGEMERDTLISNQASNLLLERMMHASDVYDAVVCVHCGNHTSESDVLADVCKICGTSGSLAIMQHPRILSVFNQQLNAIGINISMKFEDA
jgi:DNA-directed RNA polymerase beta subunit